MSDPIDPSSGSAPWPQATGRTPSGYAPPAAPSDVLADLRALAQYDGVRPLGGGGMGVVYLARNTLMDREEVLKVVRPEHLADPALADRFLREMRAAARLAHPNVVTAYTAFPAGRTLVFAMEYVPGLNLADVVRTGGPLPVTKACNYAYQAALGLQHAHDRGMVHRDIKPSNLMLMKEGKKRTVKILDFGLAKAASERLASHALTATGAVLGTPEYMAPEQTRDAAGADIRADVYSLGCTLHFLLAGRSPFAADNLFDLMLAHRQEPPPRLDGIRPDVPRELAEAVLAMLAKDPADRPATPADAARRLAPFAKPALAAAVARRSSAPGTDDPVPLVPAAAETHSGGPTVPPTVAPARRSRWRQRVVVVLTTFAGVLVAVPVALLALRPEARPDVAWLKRPEPPANAADPAPVVAAEPPPTKATPAPVVVPEPPPKKAPDPEPVVPDKRPPVAPLPHPPAGDNPFRRPPPERFGEKGPPHPLSVPPKPRPLPTPLKPAFGPTVTLLGHADRWAVSDGELVYTPGKATPYDSTIMFGDPAWGDCDLSFEARAAGRKRAYKLVNLARTDHDWYYFGLYEWDDTVSVCDKFDAGRWDEQTLSRSAPAPAGGWYAVKVEVRSGRVAVRVNDKLLRSFNAGKWATGRFGLCPDAVPLRVRNLRVTTAAGAEWVGDRELAAGGPGR